MAEIEVNGFYIVELMGHRKLAGRLTTCEIGGQSMLRLDVPDGEGSITQLYNPSAVYCLIPCSEELAKRFSERVQPEPVHPWEMKLIPARVDYDTDQDL